MIHESVRPAMLQHPGRVPGRVSGSERRPATKGRGSKISGAPTMAQPRASYDAQQIERAAYFTVVIFLGRGRYDRRELKTIAEAREVAKGISDEFGRYPMIYAVSPEGLTIHVSKDSGAAAD